MTKKTKKKQENEETWKIFRQQPSGMITND